MNSPGLARIDGSRMSGAGANRRHAFATPIPLRDLPRALGGARPVPAPQVQPQHQPQAPQPQVQHTFSGRRPPPKRFLGQNGKLIPASIDNEELAILRAKITDLLEALQLQLEALKLEGDLVSPETLRARPTAYADIPIVGREMSPQQIRQQLMVVARIIETAATRVQTGAISAYLTDDQIGALALVGTDANDLISYLEGFDLEPIASAHTRLSEDHLAFHVDKLRNAVESAEEDIVTAEGGKLSPREPMEKDAKALGTLLGLGIITVVALVALDVI